MVAALKAITWGTFATAVISALLLACAGAIVPRMAGMPGDALQSRPAAPARAALANRHDASVSELLRGAEAAHSLAPH